MTELAFTLAAVPKGLTVAIEGPTIIVCGDRPVAAIPDPALANRICLLLNLHGLALTLEETT